MDCYEGMATALDLCPIAFKPTPLVKKMVDDLAVSEIRVV